MSKRMNGEGLVRQRKDGRYELRIMDGYQQNGKQKVVSFYGKTKEEVLEKKKQYDAAIECGLDAKTKHTFSSFADMWLERHQEDIEASTIEHYTYILRTLKYYLGKRPLTEVTTAEIEDVLYKLRRKNYSDSYIRSCRGMLTQIYKRAQP